MIQSPAASAMKTVRFESQCSTTLRHLVVAMTIVDNVMNGWSFVETKLKYHMINFTTVNLSKRTYIIKLHKCYVARSKE